MKTPEARFRAQRTPMRSPARVAQCRGSRADSAPAGPIARVRRKATEATAAPAADPRGRGRHSRYRPVASQRRAAPAPRTRLTSARGGSPSRDHAEETPKSNVSASGLVCGAPDASPDVAAHEPTARPRAHRAFARLRTVGTASLPESRGARPTGTNRAMEGARGEGRISERPARGPRSGILMGACTPFWIPSSVRPSGTTKDTTAPAPASAARCATGLRAGTTGGRAHAATPGTPSTPGEYVQRACFSGRPRSA